jgi:hypothetical protein
MRALILATSMQMVASARAEDTTVIQKDQPSDSSSTTVIKKRDDVNLFPIPHPEEKKVIIHKEQHEDE